MLSYFLMTNDVECFSFEHYRYEPEVAKRVLKQGLPRLLNLYDRYDVNATFFYTGKIVDLEPEVIDIVKERGKHEIACHGYSHELDRSFDMMEQKDQIKDLKKAKKIIETTANKKIISFRGPAARINKDTIVSLEKTGFLIDSSICSQRFDGPLSYGFKNKINWLFAPRLPYYLSKDNPYRRGTSNILEIPVSAFFLAYNGTMMRMNPKLTRTLWRYLSSESKKKGKPIVFIIHPNECLDLNNEIRTVKRTKNKLKSFFADSFRHKIKLKNLGKTAQQLLEKVIKDGSDNDFKFITLKDFKKEFD